MWIHKTVPLCTSFIPTRNQPFFQKIKMCKLFTATLCRAGTYIIHVLETSHNLARCVISIQPQKCNYLWHRDLTYHHTWAWGGGTGPPTGQKFNVWGAGPPPDRDLIACRYRQLVPPPKKKSCSSPSMLTTTKIRILINFLTWPQRRKFFWIGRTYNHHKRCFYRILPI